MKPASLEKEAQCKIIMTDVFPGSDLVVSSQVFNRDQFGESITIQGNPEALTTLHSHLRKLLNRGGAFYFWSGVHRNPTNPPGIYLLLEETGLRQIPRLELIEFVFRRDVVDHCDLLISPQAFIEVVSPWGHFISKQTVGLPMGRNGTIPIGPLL